MNGAHDSLFSLGMLSYVQGQPYAKMEHDSIAGDGVRAIKKMMKGAVDWEIYSAIQGHLDNDMINEELTVKAQSLEVSIFVLMLANEAAKHEALATYRASTVAPRLPAKRLRRKRNRLLQNQSTSRLCCSTSVYR